MTTKQSRRSRGATIIELVIVIVITAIIARAFSAAMVPMMNAFLFVPQSARVNNAGADVLQIIIEGDEKAKGLRFTGLPCTEPISGASTITTATATTLTYNYALSDACGTGGTNSNSVALIYDSVNHIVTRNINAGGANAIPYYATNASGIKIDPPTAVSFFRYYDATPAEMTGGGIVLANIYRVDITVNATSGSGNVKHNAGQIVLKAGVDIKRYTT